MNKNFLAIDGFPNEKQKTMLELFINGRSSKAGVDLNQ